MFRSIYHWRLVLALAMALAVVALGRSGSLVAGGADSYGYVSEARLWLRGDLHVRQDVMQAAPWPNAARTFTPLGYDSGRDPFYIVPVHAPGLPILMATAVLIGGWCAAFWVVPLSGGVLVLATYAVGARLGRPLVGLAAALLVVTSPAVLVMLLQPMSDLPAAAAFTAALALVLGGGRAAAFGSGLAVAVGILVRPNLVPVAGVFLLHTLWRDLRTRPGRFVTPYFAAAAAAGIVIEALVNDSLYGSPLKSGYGHLDYATSHLLPNLLAYWNWLQWTQGPLIGFGLLALALPSLVVWRTPTARGALGFLVSYVLAVVVPFLFYSVNEAWWYLRYVLPVWPVMMLGMSACVAALFGRRGRWGRAAGVAAVAVLAWLGWANADRLAVFQTRSAEQKYIDAARLVDELVDENAAILAVQHSGSIRHYAGRMTLRWDMFQRGTIDDALVWLDASGHHPYLLVEAWEADLFRTRYGRTDEAARLGWAPIATLEAASTIHLYDLADRRNPPDGTRVVVTRGQPTGDQCVVPKPWLRSDW